MRVLRDERRPGLLARLFCFAPSARVGHAPASSSREKQQGIGGGTGAAAAGGQAPTPLSGFGGGGGDAVAAYLGSQRLTPVPHPPPSRHGSCWQTASCEPEAGYDADSDHQPTDDLESCSSVSGQRRFAPATRCAVRPRRSSGSRGDAQHVNPLEAADLSRQADSSANGATSMGRGGNKQSIITETEKAQDAAGGTSCMPPPASCAVQSLASPRSPATAHAASRLPSFSRMPSRDGSVLTLADDGSSTASITASSISLAHLLSGSSAGSTSSKRKLRRIGSTQVVISRPASPGPEAAPAPAAKPALSAGAFASSAAAAAAAAAAGQEARGAPVQRRLTDIHSGHFVSLHKLQRQCGDLSEPPTDLLSLLARRFLGGCDQELLAKQLGSSESRLPAMAAETETEARGEQGRPCSPATPSLDTCQAPDSPQLALDCLPQLPPIRTRVAHSTGGRAALAELQQLWSA
ncbi:hypothetical protein D9Q98_003580 [Chlorella vulgaris]|uniref:Uncharacterized protein n=1 Tax=Chlorella vulgaris TaxID=3077 RepID=A0A9D4YZ37_CHLVU|nr:hypothetical protein D9Q98_003580 [Chlorella vulgaris]